MATGDMQQAQIAQALDRLWKQYLPTVEERLAVLETAAGALAQRQLTDEERSAASVAAHKLAGVLGIFGLTQGTVLAREAEILYCGDPDTDLGTDSADAGQLAEIAAQLKTMIAGRK